MTRSEGLRARLQVRLAPDQTNKHRARNMCLRPLPVRMRVQMCESMRAAQIPGLEVISIPADGDW